MTMYQKLNNIYSFKIIKYPFKEYHPLFTTVPYKSKSKT